MKREDLRLKLQMLLGEEHSLSDEETQAIAYTITTLVYSSRATKLLWYKEMQRVSSVISQSLHERAEEIMNELNMSEEEKAEYRKNAKSKAKNDKLEN
jgi:hypothetical protein